MFARLETHYQRARQSVWLFYLISSVMAYHLTLMLHQEALTASQMDYVWPVMWLEGRDLVRWVDILSTGAFLTALGASWKPDVFGFRLGFAVCTLMCGGFLASFGGINHLYHAWFWMAAVLVILPRNRLGYCRTFANAQALLLAFYSLAGFWKVGLGIVSLWMGIEGNLAPRGLALTLADRILQTGTEPLLGRLFVEYYLLAWPLFLGLIYIQLVSIAVVFKPRLHVPWGLALLGFHIGTWLLMEIAFPLHFMLLIVFLILSPFRVEWMTWKALEDLPLLGFVFRWRPRQSRELVPAE